MESNESKEAKKRAWESWKKELNWRNEEIHKRYQESNDLIPKRPLRPKHKERDVDRWRCELYPNEFKDLRQK